MLCFILHCINLGNYQQALDWTSSDQDVVHKVNQLFFLKTPLVVYHTVSNESEFMLTYTNELLTACRVVNTLFNGFEPTTVNNNICVISYVYT